MSKGSAVLAGILIIVGCSDNPTSSSTDKLLDSGGVTLSIIQGNNQTATVTDILPLACIVELRAPGGEQEDNPLPGVLVNFVVTDGSGNVYAGSAITDDVGRAAEIWTMGTVAGSQSMEARAVKSDGTPVVFETFKATAEPGLAVDANYIWSINVGWLNEKFIVSERYGGVDQYGNEEATVDPSTFTLSIPEPFQSSGDTIWSAVEDAARVSVHFPERSTSITFVALNDLRNYDWTIDYWFHNGPDNVDTLRVHWDIGSVEYIEVSRPTEKRAKFIGTVIKEYIYFGGASNVDTLHGQEFPVKHAARYLIPWEQTTFSGITPPAPYGSPRVYRTMSYPYYELESGFSVHSELLFYGTQK